ncbi:ankyrin repeat-containing domain protein [Aspergillus leporis]|uniref:Ankyrin repeat-containing domain protein n=1 Tax=Aspergillus leporis TaxID=41062 RepID=A0A5N5WRU5_9EURO|nr:ankyrin repeat-containing domain protein [Aspergillus leporis]
MLAAEFGAEDMVAELLRSGNVDVNLRDDSGRTPLIAAARLAHMGIMKLLLAKGVDPVLKNDVGNTPLIVAAGKGNVKAVELLLSKGKVNADFDLRKRTIPMFVTRTLNESIVKILDEYKQRHSAT